MERLIQYREALMEGLNKGAQKVPILIRCRRLFKKRMRTLAISLRDCAMLSSFDQRALKISEWLTWPYYEYFSVVGDSTPGFLNWEVVSHREAHRENE
ncbi:hypothetical protein AAY473_021162 [Plecturocebus cupreus]